MQPSCVLQAAAAAGNQTACEWIACTGVMQAATEAAIHGDNFTIKIKTPSKHWC
jgi:hypothetical protein